jgi:predicted acetyltransferase
MILDVPRESLFILSMWQTKTFKTRAALNQFVEKHSGKYQIEEIAVNNRFAVNFRKLVWVRMPR